MNYRWTKKIWHGSVFCLYKNFSSPQQLRNLRNHFPYIKRTKNPAGHHFSYLGGKEQIKLKLKSIIEGDKASVVGNIDDFIDDCIKNGKSLYDWQNKDKRNFLKLITLEEIGFPNIEKIANEHKEWFYLDGGEK